MLQSDTVPEPYGLTLKPLQGQFCVIYCFYIYFVCYWFTIDFCYYFYAITSILFFSSYVIIILIYAFYLYITTIFGVVLVIMLRAVTTYYCNCYSTLYDLFVLYTICDFNFRSLSFTFALFSLFTSIPLSSSLFFPRYITIGNGGCGRSCVVVHGE